LIVAIPALLTGSVLSAWARSIKRDMEHAALRVTNAFLGRPISDPDTPENKTPVFADAPMASALSNPA
jgi:biopolymer transport protein ExbB